MRYVGISKGYKFIPGLHKIGEVREYFFVVCLHLKNIRHLVKNTSHVF